MRLVVLATIGLLACLQVDAQLLRDLKNAANNKARALATKENLNKATSSLLKNMERARAEFDSTDFDYAILISDNAGLFDVQEKANDSPARHPLSISEPRIITTPSSLMKNARDTSANPASSPMGLEISLSPKKDSTQQKVSTNR